jgi:transposase/transposase InsO family protein
MLIHLHSQATTTPKVRAAIQESDEVGTVLAERFGVTPQTIYKWRKRDSVEDRSHTPHKLQTTLTPAQEAVAVALRKALLVSLDDLLAVVREFLNPHVSRSGLDRCLRRHGVGNLRDVQAKAARPKHSGFKAYEPGYLHIDVKYLPQMADETSRRYLFVAIDRATRWVFIRVFRAKTAANARRFLRDLERACPIRIRTILTDNGKEFTDRLFGLRKRAATGEHEFDKLCAELGIEHRLTPPKSPQTNGMVERFNGRIEEVLQSHHFRSGEELEATLHRYVWLYNQQLPQSALGSKSPLQAMKDWHKLKPELFRKQPYYLPGCDSYVKPFIKRQKNDAADAEAIVEAAQRPTMRFVEPKSADQQARAVAFRTREQLVKQRTEAVNALRSYLYEFGHVAPEGIGYLPRLAKVVDDPDADIPDLAREICRMLLEQIAQLTDRINALKARIAAMSNEADMPRQLQTMPGVGPITALAVETFAPPMEQFRRGRDFAAWLGLVPRQHSTGGKQKLGKTSKMGQRDIRRLLVIGATAVIRRASRRGAPKGSWLARMLERKPVPVVAVALANKMARGIWAMLTRGETYRGPVLIGA